MLKNYLSFKFLSVIEDLKKSWLIDPITAVLTLITIGDLLGTYLSNSYPNAIKNGYPE